MEKDEDILEEEILEESSEEISEEVYDFEENPNEPSFHMSPANNNSGQDLRNRLLNSKQKRINNFNNKNSNQPSNEKNENALEEVKKSVTEEAKQVAKTYAKEEIKKQVKTKVALFVASNPWVWVVAAVIALLLIIIFAILGNEIVNQSQYTSLNGYSYYSKAEEYTCETYTVLNSSGEVLDSGVTLEDFVTVSLYSEAAQFDESIEFLKAQAVAIRTTILHHNGKTLSDSDSSNDCEVYPQLAYDAEDKVAALNDGSIYKEAVNSTRGLVLIENENITNAFFSALCYHGRTDAGDYLIGYGTEFFSDLQYQEIPAEFLDSQSVASSYIDDNNYCKNNHDYGMSQHGGNYLASTGMSFKEILEFYYGELEIMSLYVGGSYNNYTTSTAIGIDAFVKEPLLYHLNDYGVTLEEYNEYLLNTVLDNGVGTREAVVAVAVALVGNLYESYGIILPYTMSGNHASTTLPNDIFGRSIDNIRSSAFYGLDPNWGSELSRYWSYGEDGASVDYYGPDCSGFVAWSLHNAGFKGAGGLSGTQGDYGPKHSLTKSSDYIAKPGDLVWNDGHIMLVVGTDYENEVIYIAHASGTSNGTIINPLSIYYNDKSSTKNDRYVVDMDNYYATTETYTQEEFSSVFNSKMLINDDSLPS